MTEVMSFQYPPPPPSAGADMNGSPSGYVQGYPVSAPASIKMDPDLSKALKLKQDPSMSDARLPQHQSLHQVPSPSQQSMSAEQSSLGLVGEKKRNKLGYHRTSVACGHCRRRKIRCIPSPNDVQGRCINCIRLKKDCSFFPVDQAPPPQDTRQKASSRSSVGPKVGSACSSPAMQTGMPPDVHGQQPYALVMPQNMPSPVKPSADSFSADSKMPSSTRPYEYGRHGITNWMLANASSNSSKPGDHGWRSYPNESPITPAFSPYTPHAPPSATWRAPVSADPSAREDAPWSSYPATPGRSLSFGSEAMPPHQQQQYPSLTQVASHSSGTYDRKSSEMYPAPVATPIPGIEGTPVTTLGQAVSISARAVPPNDYGTWSTYPYSKPSDGYGQWYGENGPQQPLGSGESGHPAAENDQSGSSMYYSGR